MATVNFKERDSPNITIITRRNLIIQEQVFAPDISSGVISVNGKVGVVIINKTDVGLGNVDNTSDANKPVSTATQTALDLKVDKVTGKGLSDENYTLLEKQKLAGIEAGAEVNNISDANATDLTDGGETTLHTHDGRYYTETETDTLLSGKQPLATVLTNTTASFTTAQETKLAGIATNANNYVHPNHSGDVVSVGDGTTTIQAGVVNFAKMQDISSSNLLGRHSGGSGNIQTIGIDGGLELQGGNLRRQALTGDVTAAAGDNSTTIANGAVTAAKTDAGVQASLANADSALQPAVAATGAVIDFTTSKVFNSPASPSTANITDNLTGAKIGIVQKIYHNHSVAPTVPAGWVLLGSGTYTLSTLNIIFAEWASSTRVEYWIVQPA
jgi:hypothetical protein